jgi:hypothetical protein
MKLARPPPVETGGKHRPAEARPSTEPLKPARTGSKNSLCNVHAHRQPAPIVPAASCPCTRDEYSQTRDPLAPFVSPSRYVFQRLTNELSRNFPCSFGHTPVVFHLDRFHEKPPKTRTTPTHARHKCWHSFQRPCVTLCHLRIAAAQRAKSQVGGEDDRRELYEF